MRTVYHVAFDCSKYEQGIDGYWPLIRRTFNGTDTKDKYENYVEAIRVDRYPSLPSRLNALFVAKDKDSAFCWAKEKYKSVTQCFYLYELQYDEEDENIQLRWFNSEKILDVRGIAMGAESYWKSCSIEASDYPYEGLLIGRPQIIGKTKYKYCSESDTIVEEPMMQ